MWPKRDAIETRNWSRNWINWVLRNKDKQMKAEQKIATEHISYFQCTSVTWDLYFAWIFKDCPILWLIRNASTLCCSINQTLAYEKPKIMKALFQTFSTHFSIIKLFESRLFPWFEKFMNKFSNTFKVHWKLLQTKAIVVQQQNKTGALYMSIIIRKYVCSKYESNNFQLTKMIFS